MTDVRIETVSAPVLYLPGPIASKAHNILTRIRDLAVEGERFMRYADEGRLDLEGLERIAESLHVATRPMRRGLEAHNHELHARQFAADTGTDTETPDDEPSPELEP